MKALNPTPTGSQSHARGNHRTVQGSISAFEGAETIKPLRLIFLIAGLATTCAHGAGHVYTVRVDAQLRQLEVNACFGAPAPAALVSADDQARRYLQGARWSDGTPLAARNGRLELGEAGDRCLSYRVDIGKANRKSNARRQRSPGKNVIVDASTWLWRPDPYADTDRLTLRFDLPEDLSYSVPWAPVPGKPHTYEIGHTPAHWPTRTAFGRFASSEIDVPGARLRLAVVAKHDRAHDISQWLSANALAVSTLYGEFPLASPQILVTESRRGSASPVPWGQVLRGGYPAVMLVIDTSHDLDAFLDDWTTSHELSHLLLPYISRREAWLGEGFASYYQNVLRARAGMLSQHDAWQKLHQGFERGLKGTRGKPLSQATRRMHSDGAYMRVYWSGVAIVLLADVEIRRQTGQEHSLDTALESLRDCCLPSDRVWRASQLAGTIDELTGTQAFSSLVDRYAHAETFPAVKEMYPQLGIVIRPGGVELDDEAPLAHLRRAITAPRVSPD